LKAHIDCECFDSLSVWFSLSYDAAANVDSSNPRWYYETLKRIGTMHDEGHRLIEKYRLELRESVRKSKRPTSQKVHLRGQIRYAALEDFEPEIWRVDLRKVALRRGCSVDEVLKACRKDAEQSVKYPQKIQPDEYLIRDLQHKEGAVEFTVIESPGIATA
jgi:hypothetical protein